MRPVAPTDNQPDPQTESLAHTYDQRWDDRIAELQSARLTPTRVIHFLRDVIRVKMVDLATMPTLRRSYFRVTASIIATNAVWQIAFFTRGISFHSMALIAVGHLCYYAIICPLVWMNLHRIQNPPAGEPSGVDHWTLPNIISYTRLLFVPAIFSGIVVPYYTEHFAIAVFSLYGLLWVSDFADGQVSRWLKLQSYFGRLFDPFVDIVFHIFLALGLWIRGILPWWFCVAVLLRYLLPLVASFVYLIWKGTYEVSATFIGKVTGFVAGFAIGLGIFVHFLRPQWRSNDIFRGWLLVATAVCLANVIFIVLFGMRLLRAEPTTELTSKRG